jgi:hypothetical protein
MITLEPVQSSNLASRGYDEDRRVLAVAFKSGDLYHYGGVPVDVWERFRDADSPGAFFHRHIRGQFTAEKMTGTCPDCGAKGPKNTRCQDCGCNTYQVERIR